jgi:hypothetical protein
VPSEIQLNKRNITKSSIRLTPINQLIIFINYLKSQWLLSKIKSQLIRQDTILFIPVYASLIHNENHFQVHLTLFPTN